MAELGRFCREPQHIAGLCGNGSMMTSDSRSWLLTLDGIEVTRRLTHTNYELTRLAKVDVFSQCIRQGIGMVGTDNAELQNHLANGR